MALKAEGSPIKKAGESDKVQTEADKRTQFIVFSTLPESVKKDKGIKTENDVPKTRDERKDLLEATFRLGNIAEMQWARITTQILDHSEEPQAKVLARIVKKLTEEPKGMAPELLEIRGSWLKDTLSGVLDAVERGDQATAQFAASAELMLNKIEKMDKILFDNEFDDQEIKRFNVGAHDAMLSRHEEAIEEGKKKGLKGAELEGYANREAQKAGFEYVITSEEYRKLAKEDKQAAGIFLSEAKAAFAKGDLADEAYRNQDPEAWYKLSDAGTKQDIENVAREYHLASLTGVGALFDIFSDMVAGSSSAVAPGAEAAAAAQRHMDIIQWQLDQQQKQNEMKKQTEEEEEKRAEELEEKEEPKGEKAEDKEKLEEFFEAVQMPETEGKVGSTIKNEETSSELIEQNTNNLNFFADQKDPDLKERAAELGIPEEQRWTLDAELAKEFKNNLAVAFGENLSCLDIPIALAPIEVVEAIGDRLTPEQYLVALSRGDAEDMDTLKGIVGKSEVVALAYMDAVADAMGKIAEDHME